MGSGLTDLQIKGIFSGKKVANLREAILPGSAVSQDVEA
jgi:hypothetical protein